MVVWKCLSWTWCVWCLNRDRKWLYIEISRPKMPNDEWDGAPGMNLLRGIRKTCFGDYCWRWKPEKWWTIGSKSSSSSSNPSDVSFAAAWSALRIRSRRSSAEIESGEGAGGADPRVRDPSLACIWVPRISNDISDSVTIGSGSVGKRQDIVCWRNDTLIREKGSEERWLWIPVDCWERVVNEKWVDAEERGLWHTRRGYAPSAWSGLLRVVQHEMLFDNVALVCRIFCTFPPT